MPHTGRESGKIACAERGRFADDRTANRAVRNIALELHQEAVAAGTAVHRKGGEGSAGIAFHGGQQVVHLIGDGLLCGADNVLAGRAARQTDETAACVHIPMRRAQTGECRHEVHAAGVLHLARIVFRIAALGEKAHLIPQPLDDGAADKHAALERVLRLSADLNADGGQQAVFALAGGRAGVHQQKTARAVGVFRIACRKAGLTEQRRLLVACNACNRNIAARQGNRTVHLA